MQSIQRLLGAILNSRSAYETFERVGNRDELGAIGGLLVDAVRSYYELDPNAQSVDRSVIEERVVAQLANAKHAEAYSRYLRAIPDDVSSANVEFDLQELHRQRIGEQLAIAITNQAPAAERERLTQEYQDALKPTGIEVDENHGFLLASEAFTDQHGTASAASIKLWPEQLNDHIDGGVGPGNLIVVFARPDTGKTLFGINQCASFVQQGKRVLYLGNEEPVWRVRARFMARLLRATPARMREDAQRAREAAKNRGGDLLVFKDIDASTDARAIERLIRAWKADIVVIDQLHKIRVKSDSTVNQLEAQAATARDLAKRLGVVVLANTQAGVSADGKVVLDMTDIEGSKTGIPANADLLLGIGKTDHMWRNGLLELSICKNKLGASHDHFTIHVNPKTGEIT
jgi:archaellum biogenesis ATPase FlaH